MVKLVILQPVILEGVHRAAGDLVVVGERDARYAVKSGRARFATAKDSEHILAFQEGLATAVPGGKRPGRRSGK